MKKVVAVTGANGFIAKHIISELKRQNFTVKKVYRKSNLVRSLTNADTIINTVGSSASQTFDEHIDANVVYLSKLCLAAHKNNVRKIIHISASALYTNTEYGLSKKLGEEVCKFYHKHNKTEFTILRPPSVYGPGAKKGVVNIFANIGNTVTIFGDGKQKRDFMHVNDLVSAVVKAIGYKNSYDGFDVGSGKVYSLLDLVKALEKVRKKKITIKHVKEDTTYAKQVSSNISIARNKLNWEPNVDLEEGLERIIL